MSDGYCEKTDLTPAFCAHCRKSDEDGIPKWSAGIGLPAMLPVQTKTGAIQEWIAADEAFRRGKFGRGKTHG